MPYTYSTDPARFDFEVIHALLAGSYWSPRIRREVVERAFANSVACVAIDQATGRVVGVARVVTDHATFAWLCDVIVAESHRARGVAKGMLRTLEAQPGLTTLRRWCLATRDAHSLYRALGYRDVEPGRWMERKGEAAWWADAE
ncbi:MAG: GNAT family N-acetyltransferase [Phycisphaerales bacterium]|nr:GNAT family N-acetyltransferase [Phycisphaerales bacterium]